MRVPFTRVRISYNYSTSYGTDTERLEVLKKIVQVLIDAGAPIEISHQNPTTPTGAVGIAIVSCRFTDGSGYAIRFAMSGTTSSDWAKLNILICNVNSGYSDAKHVALGPNDNSKYINIYVRYIKAGDMLCFGIEGNGANTTLGADVTLASSIAFAFTKVRKLSDPDGDYGSAVVADAFSTTSPRWGRTKIAVDGKTDYTPYFANVPASHFLPETVNNKVPLIPLFMNVEDYYYEGVYITNRVGSATEEQAIQTNDGVFLLTGDYGVDWSSLGYCRLMYDITAAVITE